MPIGISKTRANVDKVTSFSIKSLRTQFLRDLSKKQLIVLILVGLFTVAGLGTMFWIVPYKYHFFLILGIFCLGLLLELVSGQKRNKKSK